MAIAGLPRSSAGSNPVDEASALYRRALIEEKRDTFDSRRQALKLLERATLLAPDSVAYHLQLARLCYRMGFLGRARQRFERVARIDSADAEAHHGQGLVWRRDYLKYLERGSLTRSVAEFQHAGRLRPGQTETWIQLVPLLVEQGKLAEAMRAAEAARATSPDRPEGLLAIGHIAFRLGQVERADSAFRLAIPRLARAARERFLDIAPVASEADTTAMRRLPVAQREGFKTRFWRDLDPDLATPENEAQLEYWSRVTQAYFLFFNPRRNEWDQRGEVYVRYGPPEKAEYNPVGTSLRFQRGGYGVFPMNVLVWSYPGLGMTVPMEDRLLSEYYMAPFSLLKSTDPVPDADSLSHRTGDLVSAGGRAVFPMLPPGVSPLPIDVHLALFSGDRGPRLLGWVQIPGAPSDSMWAEWVVLDSSRAVVDRVRRPLGVSACDAAALRVADFAAQLPPGNYLVGLSARGPGGRRGLERAAVEVEVPSPALEMSDVVVTCGTSPAESGPSGEPVLRLAVNPAARVRGDEPLTAYFEVYHLQPDAGGLSRLEFEYTVRSGERDSRIWLQRLVAPRRSLPDISARRQEEQPGNIRRQFVNVPVHELPPGRYRLEIRVRDLMAGTEQARVVEFVKDSGSGS